MFSRGELNELADDQAGGELRRSDVTIEIRSTRCDDHAAVACPSDESPAIETFVDSKSIIVDFSNVEEPGAFADVDFEGIVIEVAPGANKPIFLAKLGDETNLNIGPDAIRYDRDFVEVNLAGVPFDSESFLQIDLLVGPLNLLGRSE